jgi:hypothetical protein
VTVEVAWCHSIVAFLSSRGTFRVLGALFAWDGLDWNCRRAAMDWRHMTERTTDPVRATVEEEAAYAAGWTISGLATIGTIIVVWMFAI